MKKQPITAIVLRAALLTVLNLFILCNYTYAQRGAVKRNTAERIHSCSSLNCTAEEMDYNGMDLSCLNCLLYRADSSMAAEYNRLLVRLSNQKDKLTSLKKNQEKWKQVTQRKAAEEADQYKGGTMETTEYVRTTLLLTEKRIQYLKQYKS